MGNFQLMVITLNNENIATECNFYASFDQKYSDSQAAQKQYLSEKLGNDHEFQWVYECTKVCSLAARDELLRMRLIT